MPTDPSDYSSPALTIEPKDADRIEMMCNYFKATKHYKTGGSHASRNTDIQKRTDAIIAAGNAATETLLFTHSQTNTKAGMPLAPEQVEEFSGALTTLTKAYAAVLQRMFANTVDANNTDAEVTKFTYVRGFAAWNFMNSGFNPGSELLTKYFPEQATQPTFAELGGRMNTFHINTHQDSEKRGVFSCPTPIWESFSEAARAAGDSLLDGKKFSDAARSGGADTQHVR